MPAQTKFVYFEITQKKFHFYKSVAVGLRLKSLIDRRGL